MLLHSRRTNLVFRSRTFSSKKYIHELVPLYWLIVILHLYAEFARKYKNIGPYISVHKVAEHALSYRIENYVDSSQIDR